MLGPIDYVVVGFEGNNFDGSIISELTKAVKDKIIRIIDIVFIVKDQEGAVIGGEFEDQSPELKSAFKELSYSDDTPLFTEDDIDKIGQNMNNDTAAGVLVIEHLWAKGLKKAILDKGGFLISEGRIHPANVEAALEELSLTK